MVTTMNGTPNDDVVLRVFGFRIHNRPKQGDVIWKRGDVKYSYLAAMEECRRIVSVRIEELKEGVPQEATP